MTSIESHYGVSSSAFDNIMNTKHNGVNGSEKEVGHDMNSKCSEHNKLNKDTEVYCSTEEKQWTPIELFAPEFSDTELDIPGTMVNEDYFEFYVTQMQIENTVQDLLLAHRVAVTGVPNKEGCRIPLVTNWNLDNFQSLLEGYEDLEVLDWLRFEFTVARDHDNDDPKPAAQNHIGATLYPEVIDQYI